MGTLDPSRSFHLITWRFGQVCNESRIIFTSLLKTNTVVIPITLEISTDSMGLNFSKLIALKTPTHQVSQADFLD